MFDLSKEKIDVKCNCGRKHTATFQDAINGRIIKCICGDNIELKDSKDSVKKSVKDINKAFKDLENSFKSLSR